MSACEKRKKTRKNEISCIAHHAWTTLCACVHGANSKQYECITCTLKAKILITRRLQRPQQWQRLARQRRCQQPCRSRSITSASCHRIKSHKRYSFSFVKNTLTHTLTTKTIFYSIHRYCCRFVHETITHCRQIETTTTTKIVCSVFVTCVFAFVHALDSIKIILSALSYSRLIVWWLEQHK